jgi:hypothetical protein
VWSGRPSIHSAVVRSACPLVFASRDVCTLFVLVSDVCVGGGGGDVCVGVCVCLCVCVCVCVCVCAGGKEEADYTLCDSLCNFKSARINGSAAITNDPTRTLLPGHAISHISELTLFSHTNTHTHTHTLTHTHTRARARARTVTRQTHGTSSLTSIEL